ncbi:MAG: flagellar hook-associated protein FlgL [Acidobacteriaceae bacterium]
MRADLSLTSNLVDAIQSAKQDQDSAIFQLSSGKRIRNISDDAAAASQLNTLSSEQAAIDSYVGGGASLRSRLSAADSALSSAVQLATRAVSLGVEGANGTASPAERAAVANDLQGVHDQLLGIANSQFQGHYLFSGEADGSAAFAVVNGSVTYQGSSAVAQIDIGEGIQMSNGRAGSVLFGSDGTNVFDAISGVISALRGGTDPAVAPASLGTSLDRLTSQRVFYGTAMDAIDTQSAIATASKQRIVEQQNTLDGADFTAAAARMSQSELVQSAASAAFAKVANLSLFDYLGTTNA